MGRHDDDHNHDRDRDSGRGRRGRGRRGSRHDHDDDGEARGSRRRVFGSGEFALLLLHLVAEHPRHGYDLIRAVEAITSGSYSPSPGMLYPTLTLLEQNGQLAAGGPEGGEGKKVFSLTPAGKAYLNGAHDDLQAILHRLQELGQGEQQVESGPIARAMQNLAAVLRQHAARELDRETMFNIVDIIDEAARKIERL